MILKENNVIVELDRNTSCGGKNVTWDVVIQKVAGYVLTELHTTKAASIESLKKKIRVRLWFTSLQSDFVKYKKEFYNLHFIYFIMFCFTFLFKRFASISSERILINLTRLLYT